MPTFRIGSSGDEVRKLQEMLNNNGASLSVDGIYGTATANAVRNYQSANGLSVDGIAGTNTLAKLNGASNTGGGEAKKTPAQLFQEFHDANPDGYKSNYESQIAGLLEQLTSQGEFSYDAASDPMYQHYAQRYRQQGRQAMEDTMSQATELTGGYANSWAQSVGQMQYQNYMDALNDTVPQLRDAAYRMYWDRRNGLQNDLNTYRTLDSDEYNKWLAQRSFLYQQAQDAQAQANFERQLAESRRYVGGSGRSSGGGGGETGLTDPQFKAFINQVSNSMNSSSVKTLDGLRKVYIDAINNKAGLSSMQYNDAMQYFQSIVSDIYFQKKGAVSKNTQKEKERWGY